jgi:hypothetical protein
MEMRGCLSELSLSEVCQFVGQLQQSGCLSLRSQSGIPVTYYLWFDNGQVVAASKETRSNPLFWLIQQQGWMNYHTVARLGERCPEQQPIGQYLGDQGLLKAGQLRRLFQLQVGMVLRAVAKLEDCEFGFESDVVLPNLLQTGLSVAGQDIEWLGRSLTAVPSRQSPIEMPLAA